MPQINICSGHVFPILFLSHPISLSGVGQILCRPGPSLVLPKHRRKASSAWSKTVEVIPSPGLVQTSVEGAFWHALCNCWAFTSISHWAGTNKQTSWITFFHWSCLVLIILDPNVTFSRILTGFLVFSGLTNKGWISLKIISVCSVTYCSLNNQASQLHG